MISLRLSYLLLLAVGVLQWTNDGRQPVWQSREDRTEELAMDTTSRQPGRVERGQFAHDGATRSWRLFVPSAPRTPGSESSPAGLVLLLHGCTQDADDIARGTRIEEHAERAGMFVLAPEQPASAHPQKCWNWYAPGAQAAGGREVAWLDALLSDVLQSHRIDRGRVHVVGMSAGAAMGELLVSAHPARFASLTMASGVPVGAAESVPDALSAMRSGPREGAATVGKLLDRMRGDAAPLPLLLLHGDDDVVVSPNNRDAALRQWRELLAAQGVALTAMAPVASGEDGARAVATSWRDANGRTWVESWRFGGVGHAWSGGDPAGSYVASGADASRITFAFIAAQERARAAGTSR